MSFGAVILLSMAIYMVDSSDVSGSRTVLGVRKTVNGVTIKGVDYSIHYKEFHGSTLANDPNLRNPDDARMVKFDCSPVVKNAWKRSACYKNSDPHQLCKYTKSNAREYYGALAIKFGGFKCRTNNFQMDRLYPNRPCTWRKVDCRRQLN